MELDWSQVVTQIPLVIVIAYLFVRVLMFVKEMMDVIKAMNSENSQTIKQINESTLNHLTTQAAITQKFLEGQQASMAQVIARLAEELKDNKTDTIKELAALTQRIDGVIDKAIMLERLLPSEVMNPPKRIRKNQQ